MTEQERKPGRHERLRAETLLPSGPPPRRYAAATAAITACTALILAGCATKRERVARRNIYEMERETYGASSTAPLEKPALPLLTTESTLQDYLRYAALNNPGLEAAFNRWKAALEKVPQARALPDPRFTYAWFIKNVETRVGPQENMLGGSQAIPWLDKLRLRGGIALEEADAARQRYEAEKLDLFYRVKDAYDEYYYVSRAIIITQENRDLLEYFEKIARTKYKVGTAQHPDVIKAQVELGKVDDRLRSLEDYREPVVARLNAALNRPTDSPLPAPESIPEERIEASDDDLIAWLKNENPELRALAFDIEKERKAITLARENFIPDAAFGFDWIDTGKGVVDVSGRGKDPYIARVSVNLPLWYEKYKAAEREARARFLAAQNRLKNRENNLAYELQRALYDYRDAERKINLYRDTLVPKGRESLKATETSYGAGKLDFLNLIDAQRILLEFELAYEKALSDHARSLARLEMLVGRDLPNKVSE